MSGSYEVRQKQDTLPAVHSFHGNVAADQREDTASLLTFLSITVSAEETGHAASCLLRVVNKKKLLDVEKLIADKKIPLTFN